MFISISIHKKMTKNCKQNYGPRIVFKDLKIIHIIFSKPSKIHKTPVKDTFKLNRNISQNLPCDN